MKILCRAAAVAFLLPFTVPALAAPIIPNRGFEADSFANFPGYASGNGPVTGWSFAGNAGLNPAGGSPFADNGTVPQGTRVAFLQSAGDLLSTLSTTITGLTRNLVYVVRFRVNQRSGTALPAAFWSLNSDPFVPISAGPAVGGTNGYYYVSGTFKAGGITASLVIGNQTTVDTTLLLDDFSIDLAPPTTSSWSVSPWTNDTSTALSITTHKAWCFGSNTSFAIKGTSVTAVNGANPAVPGSFAVTGVPNVIPQDTNSLTALSGTPGGSGSANLAKSFVWGGDPATVTLENLAPGHTYVVSLFSVGWEAAGGRFLTFSSGGQQRVVDQDQYGDNNGLRIDHTFVADAFTRAITITPQVPGTTFHLYGLALRQPLLVSHTGDSGTGSMRWAFDVAARKTAPDATHLGQDFIAFDPALSGQTITLLSDIAVQDSNNTDNIEDATLDASTLPAGITLSSSGAHHHFRATGSASLTLNSLTIKDANNPSNLGGAISNYGIMTLNRCTFSGNRGFYGGAIYNHNTMSVTHCTFYGNTVQAHGGAISNDGALTLTHCTISGNVVPSGWGGGIINDGSLTLLNSIVAANVSPFGDIYNRGTITREGANIVNLISGDGTGNVIGTGTIDTAPPLLAPANNYGGLTPTMALGPGSPARNAATGSRITADQRGFPVIGAPDIGAYETGGFNNCPAYIAESLPAPAPAALYSLAADFDGDGATNEQEWNARTDPGMAASVLRIFNVVHIGTNLCLAVVMVYGRTYTLWYSDSLTGGWTATGLGIAGSNGAVGIFEVPAPVAGVPKRFYRIQAGP